jgi:hypothetical protein
LILEKKKKQTMPRDPQVTQMLSQLSAVDRSILERNAQCGNYPIDTVQQFQHELHQLRAVDEQQQRRLQEEAEKNSNNTNREFNFR